MGSFREKGVLSSLFEGEDNMKKIIIIGVIISASLILNIYLWWNLTDEILQKNMWISAYSTIEKENKELEDKYYFEKLQADYYYYQLEDIRNK